MIKHKRITLIATILLSALTLTACGGGSSSSTPTVMDDDPGTTDTGTTDTGTTDTGTTDTGTTDTGTTDTGTTDTGTTDTGTTDTGTTDTGTTDMGTIDPPGTVDIAGGILGAWVTECEVIAGGALSAREIFVFNDTQLIRDWYEFDGGECAGVPRGKRFPLMVDEYALGAEFVTENGITAREIDLTIKQLPEVDYKPGFGEVVQTGIEVGDQRFTVVSVKDGKLLWQDREPTNADNRFTNFNNGQELVLHQSLTSADVSAQTLNGIYKTACMARDDGTYSFSVMLLGDDSVERSQDHFYFNHLCLGEAAAITETPTTIEYGSAFTNDFGDTLLSTVRTREQQYIIKGEELITFELKAPRDPRYGAYALLGDTLMLGDCIIRVSDCKNTPDFPADHIDFEFNSSIRNVRTDSAEPAAGTTDTASLAGAWDGSYDLAEGGQDIFLYVISANGLVTYYDYLDDPLGSGEDCYFVYTENLTNYGNNEYLYEGFYDDGEPYSYAETVTVENNILNFISSTGESFNIPAFTGDVSSLNECV